MIAKHLIISGQVQNIGYRDWLTETARKIGLAGWVRNRRDGTVEALIAGETDAVEEVVRACRRGPRMAIVSEINETLAEPPSSREFTKRPTV
jgi:acylphosphatase